MHSLVVVQACYTSHSLGVSYSPQLPAHGGKPRDKPLTHAPSSSVKLKALKNPQPV